MINLYFKNVNISEMSINSVSEILASVLDSVEFYQSPNGDFLSRIKFYGHEEMGYIVANAGHQAMMVHYCQEQEKGIACKHQPILAAVAKHFNKNIKLTNIKTKLADYKIFENRFSKVNWINANDEFGIVSIDQKKPAQSEKSIQESQDKQIDKGKSKANVSVKGAKRDWKEGWEEVREYLDSQNVDFGLQNLILERRKRISENVELQPFHTLPTKPSLPYQGPAISRAFRHIFNGKHLILIGEQGTAKDTLINTIAWVLNLPKILQVGNRDETKETLVCEPVFKNNESSYELSVLSKTIQGGGLVNFAEVNFLRGNVTSIFHSLFDENGEIATQLGPIKKHEDFIACFTMNSGEQYSDIQKLNSAFKDRFANLILRKTLSFKELISKKTGLMDSAALEFLYEVKKQMDELTNFEKIALDSDTLRGYEDAARYFLNFGYNQETRIEAVEDYIINKSYETREEYYEAREAVRRAFDILNLSVLELLEEEEEYLGQSKGGN